MSCVTAATFTHGSVQETFMERSTFVWKKLSYIMQQLCENTLTE